MCDALQIVLFAVPGDFTPTCSSKHVPGFLEKADELKAKGVETIACVSVNDAFVMDAWGKSLGAEDKIQLLADGSAAFAKVSTGIEQFMHCLWSLRAHSYDLWTTAGLLPLKCACAGSIGLNNTYL